MNKVITIEEMFDNIENNEIRRSFNKDLKDKVQKEINETLKSGIPIFYTDSKYTKEDEIIKEYPNGRREVLIYKNGVIIETREI